jgi:hypothetical protein
MHAIGARSPHEIDAVLDQDGDIAVPRRRPQALDGGPDRVVGKARRRAQQQAGHVGHRDRRGESARQALALADLGEARRSQVESRGSRRQGSAR